MNILTYKKKKTIYFERHFFLNRRLLNDSQRLRINI